MKLLLLGCTGQVGWELSRTLLTLGHLAACDYPQVDMADPSSIRRKIRDTKPDIIVNATAYTDVDKAESEPELAVAINAIGVGILAEEAQNSGAALIHYSTDYVFDGTKGVPHVESDHPNPLSVYGETKLAGERAIEEIGGVYLIFRTSWVYSLRRPSFVSKVLEWARQHETLRIVDDQVSSPTWARTLAEATSQVIAQGRDDPIGYIQDNCGLFHLTDAGSCSRHAWAKTILELDPNKHEQVVKEILPAKSDQFPTPARRPEVSILNTDLFSSTFFLTMPEWSHTLQLAISENQSG